LIISRFRQGLQRFSGKSLLIYLNINASTMYVGIYTPCEVKEAAYLRVAVVNHFADFANLIATCATT